MKHKKKALFQSLISLLLCFSMLVGTTFAWFTDGVSSGTNMIAAGNLDIEMEYLDADGSWKKVDENTEVLDKEALWEPGYTEVAYLKISNAGNLALKYALGIGVLAETGSVNIKGEEFKLSEHIRFGLVESETPVTYADRITARNALTTSKAISEGYSTEYTLNQNGDVRYVALVVYMPEEVGNAANYATGATPPEIELGIELVATQADYESDSFGTGYDTDAEMPSFSFPQNIFGDNTSSDVTTDDDNKVAAGITIEGAHTNAVIPAGVQLEEGTEKLTLEVTSMNQSGANVTLSENEAMRSLNVHVQGVSADNTVPMEIYIKEAAAKGLNAGNLKLYHVENGATVEMIAVDTFTAHNQFKYDPATGDITLYMATFSEVAVVAHTVNPWNGDIAAFSGGSGTTADPYLIANADQLAYLNKLVSSDNGAYNAASYKLLSDIVFAGETSDEKQVWYPIGYHAKGSGANKAGESVWYTYGGAFSGVFDGAGHKVSNIYQNTWIMDGNYDNGYWKEAMGLFGYVYGGTVKNLTIHNFYSEGEFAPTGCVAAYAANATFENIAITSSHPQTYNTSVAAVVGRDGKNGLNNNNNYNLVFRNITVDSSNTVSALWGSWDVGAAGILGYLGSNSKVLLENCRVSPTIDVYNDVCGNYQYYWYRYCGMLIGTVDKTKDDGSLDLSNITAKNCTVDFGNRHEYYYCEFVENSIASYTHDYQFSRVNNSDIVGSGENATCQGHDHDGQGKEIIDGLEVLVEDKQAVYIPFRQIFGGYGWGVKGTEITEDGIEIDDITVDWSAEPDTDGQIKFASKFTGNFLYRVGNANTVSVGSLFAAIDEDKINKSGVVVSVDNYEEGGNVSGTFIANASDWKNGTIKFSGTGLAKITIQDYDYCKPTEMIVEVVDAYNATTALSAPYKYNGVNYNVVLLNDVTNGSFTVSGDYGFYGNGFTITLNPNSHSLRKGNGYAGYITMNGGTLDNVRIEGPVFKDSNIYQSQGLEDTPGNAETTVNYFRNAINIDSGNAKITNSYISGARTAICVKAGGNVVIENSQISGGAYANIEVLSATSLTLKNVVTEQKTIKDSYDKNKEVVGIGVVINNAETKLILDGLTQYNWMTQTQWESMLGDYKDQFPKLFTKDDYKKLWHTNSNNTKIVNTGVIWACDIANGEPNMQGSVTGYDKTKISLGGQNGVVYTTTHSGTSSKLEDDVINAPDYEAGSQGAVPPVAEFAYTRYDEPEQSGSNDYSYYNANEQKFKISFDQGKSKNWRYDILTVKKGEETLPYTVKVSGGAVVNADNTIIFSAAGDYIVTYEYVDSGNYKDSNGQLVSYSETYKKYVYVTVFVVEPESDPTTFEFGTNGYKSATAGGLTYVMPNVTATKEPTKSSNVVTASGIGSKTIDGQTIYYPIIGMHKVGSSMSYYNYFSIFEAVKIIDANGTDTYSTSTTSVPSNLQVIGGFINNGTESANGTAIFNYSTGKTIKTKSVTVKGTSVGLCYYPDSSFSSSTTARDEQTIVVKYCYTDTNGKAYYYYIGYWCAQGRKGVESSSTSSSCLTEGTLITMADGSKQAVETLRKGDVVMAYDHITGEIVFRTVNIVGKTYADSYYKNVFIFDDGTELAAINEHGIYDLDLNQYVNIDHTNYREFIGHRFASVDAKGNLGVKCLIDVVSTVESGYKYDIVTNETLNYVAEDMLNVSHEIVDIMNSFVFGDDMVYDAEAMKADIEKYGLYTYADFAAYCEREVFEQYNMAMMKIGVGKSLYTYEHLVYLLTEIALNENVQIN